MITRLCQDALHGMQQAKVIISHYDSEPYCSFYADWRVDRKASTQSCKGATIHSPTGAKPVVESRLVQLVTLAVCG